MQPPKFLVGKQPNGGLLWASVDPNVNYLEPRLTESRFAAYLAPFTSEDAARAAMRDPGAKQIEIEERSRGKRRG